MKIEYVNEENKKIYDNFIKEHGNLFQSLEWIKSNEIEEYNALMLREKEEIYVAGIYVITYDKEINKRVIYFPKGPIISKITKKIFKEFVDEIINVAHKNSCEGIRMDYVFKNKNKENLEDIFIDLGFTKSIYTKFWDYTWIIPIKNISKDEYIMKLKPKTRYNINYAKRHDVKVLIDNSKDSKNKFYELMKITGKRDNFAIKSKNCYDNILNFFKENANIFWTYKDNKLLSSAIEIIFGNTAYYIYGASSNSERNLQSTFLLQYEMIAYAIEKKCKVYDMGGVGIKQKNSDKFYKGLLEFKSKFGGTLNSDIQSYILKL